MEKGSNRRVLTSSETRRQEKRGKEEKESEKGQEGEVEALKLKRWRWGFDGLRKEINSGTTEGKVI